MSQASAGAALCVRGLSRVYDDHYALVALDATFPPGTITALLGPNGAGKSTLMGMLSTLMRPTEGEIRLGDAPLTDAPKVRGRIGYVGHRTMLYGPLTARENLSFFARLYGVPEAASRVDAALVDVGLGRDGDRPVDGFSRGMAQRLTLARALLSDPDLLLLDEPFTGLDQQGLEVASRLVRKRREAGAVVVLASHDLALTGTVSDRALILRRGRKVYEGPLNGDLGALYAKHTGEAA